MRLIRLLNVGRQRLQLLPVTTTKNQYRTINTTTSEKKRPQQQPTAIVLLSGGLDSATTLALAISEGHTVITLSFDYGQRHRHELQAASIVSTTLGAADHRVARVDPQVFGNSHSLSVTPETIPVPKSDSFTQSATIPSTYVPARNILFLSYGLALAESLSAKDIFIGANAVDYSGYPDCRPEFFKAFQQVIDVGTKAGVELNGEGPVVRAPLLHWSKRDIIRKGLELGVDFSMTHSCYDPGLNGKPCTRCDSCILRADAFTQLGFTVDPVVEKFQPHSTT